MEDGRRESTHTNTNVGIISLRTLEVSIIYLYNTLLAYMHV
jgi:hypothetical protein